MSPMVTNGDNGDIGANGDKDDPFETMVIHWWYNGPNGDNDSDGDNNSNGDSGNIGASGAIGDSGNIGTSGDNDDP